MLAKDILKKARYTLSDTAKDRWSDERLLALLNDGIIDIAKNTTLFIETLFYIVVNDTYDITLYDKALKVLGAEYLDLPLEFISWEEMNNRKRDWQQDKGTEVKSLVYDRQRNAQFRQYPIVENAINNNIEFNASYGIVTDISYSDIIPEVVEGNGDIGAFPDDALIKFYYIRRHAVIVDINDTVLIDELIEKPLVHYISGMALRDNQDAQNRSMGSEELSLYYQNVEEYALQKFELFVRTKHEAKYRPHD